MTGQRAAHYHAPTGRAEPAFADRAADAGLPLRARRHRPREVLRRVRCGLALACAQCRAELPAGARFCPDCGQPAAAPPSVPAAAVVAAYDFAGTSTLVDIGGGDGSLIATILAAYPQMRGILFEQRDVLDSARVTLEREGVRLRCTLVAGDFFQAVPEGGDAYLLKDIIHDWEDERALVILQRCRQAMRADGKLLLVERALPAGNAPAAGKLIDITMLTVTGGCERTQLEYRDLLARAGLDLIRVVPTASEMLIVEAVPV